MKKKIVSILLAGTFVMVSLAGCGSQGENAAEQVQAEAAVETTEEVLATEETETTEVVTEEATSENTTVVTDEPEVTEVENPENLTDEMEAE